ncbi:MAG: hypothetical protein Q4G33_12720, partial [bacterium]|nr:hypothetical protein [bacterium]
EEERERIEQEQLRRYEMEQAAQEETEIEPESAAVETPVIEEPKHIIAPKTENKEDVPQSGGYVRLSMNFRAIAEGKDRQECIALLKSLKQFAAENGIKLEKI